MMRYTTACGVWLVAICSASSVMAHPHPEPFLLSATFSVVATLLMFAYCASFVAAVCVSLFLGVRFFAFSLGCVVLSVAVVAAILGATGVVFSEWLFHQSCDDGVVGCGFMAFMDFAVALALVGVFWIAARVKLCGLTPSKAKRAWLICAHIACWSSLGFVVFVWAVSRLDSVKMVPFHDYNAHSDSVHIH